jgi:hypothetical protein
MYCPAKAVTKEDVILSASAHNHMSDPVAVKVKAAEHKVMKVIWCV